MTPRRPRKRVSAEEQNRRREYEKQILDMTDEEMAEVFPPKVRPWTESARIHQQLSDEIYFLAGYERGSDEVFSVPLSLDQVARRMLVRSICAYIEGMSFALKWIGFGLNEAAFDPGERAMIEERNYRLQDGKLKTESAKIRTEDNVRYTFVVLYKALGKDWENEPLRKDPAWKNLDAAFKIRNRLTHPRKGSMLKVTDDELLLVGKVFDWYGSTTTQLMYPAMGIGLANLVAWGKEHAGGHPEEAAFLKHVDALKPFIDWLVDPSKGPPKL
jgi:hypothetical protein